MDIPKMFYWPKYFAEVLVNLVNSRLIYDRFLRPSLYCPIRTVDIPGGILVEVEIVAKRYKDVIGVFILIPYPLSKNVIFHKGSLYDVFYGPNEAVYMRQVTSKEEPTPLDFVVKYRVLHDLGINKIQLLKGATHAR